MQLWRSRLTHHVARIATVTKPMLPVSHWSDLNLKKVLMIVIIYNDDSGLPTVGSAMTSIKHETKTDLKTKTFMPINHLGLIIAVCLCMYLSWSVFVCIHFNVSSQCPYRYDSWEGLAHPRLAARLNVILSTFCLSDTIRKLPSKENSSTTHYSDIHSTHRQLFNFRDSRIE